MRLFFSGSERCGSSRSKFIKRCGATVCFFDPVSTVLHGAGWRKADIFTVRCGNFVKAAVRYGALFPRPREHGVLHDAVEVHHMRFYDRAALCTPSGNRATPWPRR